jgi:hypothetical protein
MMPFEKLEMQNIDNQGELGFIKSKLLMMQLVVNTLIGLLLVAAGIAISLGLRTNQILPESH